RKERRQEGAARWSGAGGDHGGELAQLDEDEGGAEHKGDAHRAVELAGVPLDHREARHTAGEARHQQTGGLDGDAAQIEQLLARRPARGRIAQYGVAREEARKHHDVAEQENPEAVADHDAFRRRPSVTVPARVTFLAGGGFSFRRWIAGEFDGAHVAAPSAASASRRCLRLARSIRATSSAGMTYC